jgi:DNA-binding HxlR family transcriptional regulator
MAALDLLGRRWTLRILWELRDGPFGFRELQERCDSMSPSVLSDRLRQLHDAGLVDRDEADRHALTDLGKSLRKAIAPLGAWAETWAGQIGSSSDSGS